MTSRHALVDEAETEVSAGLSWLDRNPHSVAWLVHLLLSTAVVESFVTAQGWTEIEIVTGAGVVISALTHLMARSQTTPVLDPHGASGAPLVPATATDTPETTTAP